MIAFAAKLAAALALSSGIAAAAVAAPVAELSIEQTVVSEPMELAVYCEYIILWDAWGNAYYEYYCY